MYLKNSSKELLKQFSPCVSLLKKSSSCQRNGSLVVHWTLRLKGLGSSPGKCFASQTVFGSGEFDIFCNYLMWENDLMAKGCGILRSQGLGGLHIDQGCPLFLPGGPHLVRRISAGPDLPTTLGVGCILFILWIKPCRPDKIWSRAAFGPRARLWTCLVLTISILCRCG